MVIAHILSPGPHCARSAPQPTPIATVPLHRDLGVTQSTAWLMLHRIREAWMPEADDGPVEVDETYVGGKRRNMSNA